MPLIHQKKSDDYSIAIWHYSETLNDLEKNVSLNDQDRKMLLSFKSERRKKEWLAVRHLLKYLNGNDIDIRYDSFGKPFLDNNQAISISHTGDFVSIILAQKPFAGIDIETIGTRISILSEKFLNENEKTFCSENDIEKLHVIWGAKEVLYKIHGSGGIDFRKNLCVEKFEYNSCGKLNASLIMENKNQSFIIHYEKFNNQMLTWSFSHRN